MNNGTRHTPMNDARARRRRARAAARWSSIPGFALAAVAGLSLAGAGCSSPPTRAGVEIVTRDVDPLLTGLIGSQATLSGMNPTFVSGYGVVVGLNGTGSADVPLAVRAELESEMGKLGVGQTDGMIAVSPAQMLDDPNTAVVLVEAVVPPAAPSGTPFDVRIAALPGTAVTSLAGGRLFTTRLFVGLPLPGGPDTRPVAEARGAVFINPFSDPADDIAGQGVDLPTEGRVLNGGRVVTPFRPLLLLDNPSHSRARAIVNAINGRFPQGSARLPTARGIDEETIELVVPQEFRGRADEFFDLVRRLRLDRSFPEQWARRYTAALRDRPDLAEDLSWALRAIGPVALPSLRPLYDDADRIPRLAALQAGAWLGDPLTRSHLEELALDGPPAIRADAIGMLSRLPTDPRINLFLLDLLGSTDIDVRVAAYEGLERRQDPRIIRQRYPDKFVLHVVPASDPMVYVTQQGLPKIVLFGDLEVESPAFVSGWSGRLMVSTDSSGDAVRTFFRDHREPRTEVHTLDPRVTELIDYFAHDPTPEQPIPGLNLSYSEVVSALRVVVDGGAIDAVFLPETDRLALELVRTAQQGEFVQRPELSPDGPLDELPEPTVAVAIGSPAGADDAELQRERDPEWEQRRARYVVPLTPPTPDGERPATNNETEVGEPG